MSTEILERPTITAKLDTENPEEFDEYYWEDYDLYHSEKFAAEMDEVIAECNDILAHPEKHKFYHSARELLQDIGVM